MPMRPLSPSQINIMNHANACNSIQRNLPNKQRIGKQDPYCSITIGHQKQKTPAVKRGGQTPHWDAQLQFEIWEESSDKVPVATTDTGGIGPASSIALKKDEELLPNQATVGRVKPKTGSSDASKRIMKIACYADDPREPELIGETEIDYAPTLKKGEFDGEGNDYCSLVCRTSMADTVPQNGLKLSIRASMLARSLWR